MTRLIRFITALGLVLALASPASARECEGVNLPNAVTVDGTRLTLNGLGIREATMFNVNVYIAGLYLENRTRSGSEVISSEQRKRLVLRFVRDVDRSDITGAFDEGFGSGHGAQRRQLNSWMTDMSEGSSMEFTYVPGTGLQVEVNGRTRGTIEGTGFARAFFGIWFGSSPPNSGLKSGMLGGSCG